MSSFWSCEHVKMIKFVCVFSKFLGLTSKICRTKRFPLKSVFLWIVLKYVCVCVCVLCCSCVIICVPVICDHVLRCLGDKGWWHFQYEGHCCFFIMFCTSPTAVHCTAVHCSALQCISLHCTALHCTALQCTALHCITLNCTAIHCTAIHCTAIHCTAS